MFNFGLFSSSIPYFVIVVVFVFYYLTGALFGTPKNEQQTLSANEIVYLQSMGHQRSNTRAAYYFSLKIDKQKSVPPLSPPVYAPQSNNSLVRNGINHKYFCRPPPSLIFA